TAAALYGVVGTCKHLGIDPFAYLREALPGLFASGEKPAVEQLPEWLPDRWLLRRAREAPPASAGGGSVRRTTAGCLGPRGRAKGRARPGRTRRGQLLTLILSLSRINAWKRFRATSCVGISKRWSCPRWSGARRTAWRSCTAWKKPVAGCCGSRKGRCTRPCTGSKRPARSRRSGSPNRTAGAAPGGASTV